MGVQHAAVQWATTPPPSSPPAGAHQVGQGVVMRLQQPVQKQLSLQHPGGELGQSSCLLHHMCTACDRHCRYRAKPPAGWPGAHGAHARRQPHIQPELLKAVHLSRWVAPCRRTTHRRTAGHWRA